MTGRPSPLVADTEIMNRFEGGRLQGLAALSPVRRIVRGHFE